MYRFRLVLNDGAAGAGIRAGTAVQASTGIDDELVIALSRWHQRGKRPRKHRSSDMQK